MSHLENLIATEAVDLTDNHVFEWLSNGRVKIIPIDPNKKFTKNKIVFTSGNTDHTTKVLNEFEFYTTEELLQNDRLNAIKSSEDFKEFVLDDDELFAIYKSRFDIVGHIKYPLFVNFKREKI